MDFLTLQQNVIRNLGNRSDLLTQIKLWLNSCYMDLVTTGRFPELSHFEPIPCPQLDGVTTLLTVIDKPDYNYPADALTILALRDTTNKYAIRQRDILWYNRYRALVHGKPRIYALYGAKIYLDPMPDAVYTLQEWYRKKTTLVTLTVDEDVPIIGEEWHEAIEMGATYRGFRSLGDARMGTWLNDLSNFIRNHSGQQNKEEEDFDGGFQIVL